MDIRKELDKKIEKKKEDIFVIEKSLGEARSYLQALEDTRRMLPKEASSQAEITLRPGTDIAKVREILQQEGKPLRVEELLKRLGKPVEKKQKLSLAGSLASYARDNKIFNRPAPNTFGLVEFEVVDNSASDEPPEGFGVTGKTKEGVEF